MPASALNISGFPEVNKAIADTRERLGEAAIKATEAAIAVIEAEVYAQTPLGAVTKEGQQHLRYSIMHVIKADPHFRFVAGSVGFGSEGWRAFLVEYGHRMVGHQPGKKELKPPVPAHPFLRRAFDNCKQAAVDAFVAVLEREVKSIYG